MLLFNQDVFDEVITGTTTTWYTAASFNALLGSGDRLLVLAYPTGIPTATNLTVYLESSSDDQHWVTPAAPLWSAKSLTEGQVEKAQASDLPAFNRLKISLGGSGGSQCRLKLSVTGRAF